MLLTVGQIARRLGVDQHRVAYVIKSRRILPTDRVGVFRVFDERGEAEIAKVVEEIDAKRIASELEAAR